MELAVVLLSAGADTVRPGAAWSSVTVRLSVVLLPARSVATVVIVFFPLKSVTRWLNELSLLHGDHVSVDDQTLHSAGILSPFPTH